MNSLSSYIESFKLHASCLAHENNTKIASACHKKTMLYVQMSASNANFLQDICQIKYNENHKPLSTQIV
jgi:hypothetical protein